MQLAVKRHWAGSHTRCAALPSSSLLYELCYSPSTPFYQLQHRRNVFLDFTVPGFMYKGLLLGGTAATWFGFQIFRRSRLRQIRSIRETFRRNRSYRPHALYCDRKLEENALKAYLKNMPGNPTVIVGPDGSGKNSLMIKVLSECGQGNSIRLDLREMAITDSDGFAYYFADKIGFKMPTSDFLSRWLLSERAMDNVQMTPKELDNVFLYLRGALQQEKDEGWQNGIPIIFLSGMDNLLSEFRSKQQEIENDKELISGARHYVQASVLSKFLDFALTVTEHRLCHIVITCEHTFSRLVLDTHNTWIFSREILELDYPKEAVMAAWFKNVLNPHIRSIGRRPVRDSEILYIYSCIGGNFTDIMALLGAVERGQPVQVGVYRLVIESVGIVVRHLEGIQEAAAEARAKRPAVELALLERYARFWGMMQLLAEAETNQTPLTRSTLLGAVYSLNPAELDRMEEHRLIKFAIPKPMWLSASQMSPILKYQLSTAASSFSPPATPTAFRAELVGPQPPPADSPAFLASLAYPPPPKFLKEDPESNIDWVQEWFSSESSVLSPDSDGSSVGLSSAQKAKARINRSVIVTPFSPRMGMAFRLLVGKAPPDRSLTLSGKYGVIKQGVRDRLKRETLKSYIGSLQVELNQVQAKKGALVYEQRCLLMLEEEKRASLGTEFARQLSHVCDEMRGVDARCEELEARLRVSNDMLAELDDIYFAIKKEVKAMVQKDGQGNHPERQGRLVLPKESSEQPGTGTV
eukprot:gb/GEZN01002906.1/.p1 GENE.gb/GEZN01002906.1/~~gb/GEZN01002906.1/.p1  ORF type:complete len:770 (-),score=88.99 gb/GEZN01002906.1/:20-2272(-)